MHLKICVAALALVATPALAQISLQPGEWQETETGTEDGKPVKPEITKSCMTPEEAKDPVKQLQEMLKDPSAGQCKQAGVKQSGNSVTLTMTCGDPKIMLMDITGTFTFASPTRYTGQMKSAVTLGGKTMTSDKTVEAVRIGDCKGDVKR